MIKALKKRLDEILLESKLLTPQLLNKAYAIQKKRGGGIIQVLIEEGIISEQALMICLSKNLHIPVFDLNRCKLSEEIVRLIPEHIARHYKLIAVSKLGKNLTIAMADPLNIFAIDDVKSVTNLYISVVIAPISNIQKSIDLYYSSGYAKKIEDMITAQDEEIELVEQSEEIDIGEMLRSSSEAPVVRMVDALLVEAVLKRASDIHIEPYEKEIRIRYRIDGALQEIMTLPKKIRNAMLARLKIMSSLDITQRRLPQDGRFRIRLKDKEIDFRVSVLPISFGEKVVLRALDKSNLTVGLEKLGFLPEAAEKLNMVIMKPYGLVLVTGPTGSGKSTTLYSIITKINTADRNIITIEDPVEYQVAGITQLQVKPEISLTFASGLRSLLRQSPDIIMVGEIRDFETADIAVKACLTGQLILSTLHTNDAPSTIIRLRDMGVEPFLIASSIIAIAAQRLCRRICSDCKQEIEIKPEVLERLKIDARKNIKFYKGAGCAACNKTGYKGRFSILEIMPVDDTIKEMIISRRSSEQIKEYACKNGMQTLRDAALQNAIMGNTTLEEVLRVTAGD
ncbi:MAG: ATPase, T2SS/T4P/T4SS family [Candidatus Omnitrophota bacterium]